MEIKEVERVLFEGGVLKLSSEELERVQKSHTFLKELVKNRAVYGVNTGIGSNTQEKLSNQKLEELQYNIIHSHASGTGAAMPVEEVRAAMICRLNSFAKGYSGVSYAVVERLKEYINRDITPYVPQHGGASGDLVQLAHISLSLIGKGNVFYEGKLHSTDKLLKDLGIKPLKLKLRDGLALCNGTSVTTGIAICNLIKADKLLYLSLVASAMLNEIIGLYDDFASEKLNRLKSHVGQIVIADALRYIFDDGMSMISRKEDSSDVKSKKTKASKASNVSMAEIELQDKEARLREFRLHPNKSLKCLPQILGPIFEEVEATRAVLVDELESVDDNPIIDAQGGDVLQGGDTCSDYVCFAMDKLKIAITRLSMLAERQLNFMLNSEANAVLPPLGLQESQFTASSTVTENQMLSNPMYVQSVPCNGSQDIVSLGANSARACAKVVDNTYEVLTIELIVLAQLVDSMDIYARLSRESCEIYDLVRKLVPTLENEDVKYNRIQLLSDLLKRIPRSAKYFMHMEA